MNQAKSNENSVFKPHNNPKKEKTKIGCLSQVAYSKIEKYSLPKK